MLPYPAACLSRVSFLQAVLASAPALEELELSHSGLGQEGGAAIGAALAHCGALSLLAVGHTGFGDAGAKALAGSVRCLTKLRVRVR